MLGTRSRVIVQLKTIIPSSENVAHVCSHDHLRTRVMGRMKVPCSKPASSTRRKPKSKGIGVIVVWTNFPRTKLVVSFRSFDRSRVLRHTWVTKGSHPLL